MTLVLSINGRESNWMLADRRLSTADGRAKKDDALKLMTLETPDGTAILGYAGLGLTARGTEPSAWMSAALRGRVMNMEAALAALVIAAQAQMPQHLKQIPTTIPASHKILVSACINSEIRFYTIELQLAPDRQSHAFRHTRWVIGSSTTAPRIRMAGSGAETLNRDGKRTTLFRDLLRLVNASDRGQVSAHVVSDYLAWLNLRIHKADDSIGPRCIVVWRHRKGGFHNGGGGFQYYTASSRDASAPPFPSIVNGYDMTAIGSATMEVFLEQVELWMQTGQMKEPDTKKLNALVARIPHKPDETLR